MEKPVELVSNGGRPDGLGEVALVRAGRAEQECVLAGTNEASCRKIDEALAVELRVKAEDYRSYAASILV